MNDLFGVESEIKSNICLNIFCDEARSDDWCYLGILVVPEDKEPVLLNDILDKRCGHSDKNKVWGKCKNLCEYHARNDTEVHFSEIHDSKNKYYVAKRWVDYILSDRENVYFYILGIDIKYLDLSYFGKEGQQGAIYNRFFRTAIMKSVKSYFHGFENIAINGIYHDNNSALEADEYFPWHSILFIENRDSKISFKCKKITFLESDHRISKDQRSHFIQLTDLILGCVRNCLDHTAKDDDKEALSLQLLPLVERLIERPNNVKSHYKYVGRQKAEFFPRYKLKGLKEDSLEFKKARMDAFYIKREIRIKNRDQGFMFEFMI